MDGENPPHFTIFTPGGRGRKIRSRSVSPSSRGVRGLEWDPSGDIGQQRPIGVKENVAGQDLKDMLESAKGPKFSDDDLLSKIDEKLKFHKLNVRDAPPSKLFGDFPRKEFSTLISNTRDYGKQDFEEFPKRNDPSTRLRPASLSVTPEKFSGGKGSNTREWLASWDRICKVNAWSDEIKVIQMPIYLTSYAMRWFRSMEAERLRKRKGELTWPELREEFLKNASMSSAGCDEDWNLMNKKQQMKESCISYYYEVLNLCDVVDPEMSDKKRIQHVMRGLKPKLRQTLILHAPQTLSDLKHLLENAELSQQVEESENDYDQPIFTLQESNTEEKERPTLVKFKPNLQKEYEVRKGGPETKSSGDQDWDFKRNRALAFKSPPPKVTYQHQPSLKSSGRVQSDRRDQPQYDSRTYKQRNTNNGGTDFSANNVQKNERLCYNCRENNHIIRDCPYVVNRKRFENPGSNYRGYRPNSSGNSWDKNRHNNSSTNWSNNRGNNSGNNWNGNPNRSRNNNNYLVNQIYQTINLATDTLLFIKGKIGSQDAEILIDTGASVSIIHSKYLNSCLEPPEEVLTKIVGVHGNKAKPIGSAKFMMRLGEDFSIEAEAYVIDGINIDMLIGGDLLNQLNATINYQSEEFIIGDNIIIPLCKCSGLELAKRAARQLMKIDISNNEAQVYYSVIYNGPTFNMKPGEYAEIPGLIKPPVSKSEIDIPQYILLSHNKRDQREKKKVIPNQSLERNCDNMVQVSVQNISGKPIRFKHGIKLGEATALDTKLVNLVEMERIEPEKYDLNDTINPELSEGDRTKLLQVLQKYCKQFHQPGEPLGHTVEKAPRIKLLSNSEPIRSRMYNYSPTEKKFIEEHIDELLKNGIIQPSRSPYASPIVLVKNGHKGSEKPRLCIDFRKLNCQIEMDSYPLPACQTLLNSLQGMTIFSIIDLRMGYHQLELHELDYYLTAFITHYGLFEYKRLPFGLKCACAFFQRMIEKSLAGLIGVVCLVYLDDIIIFSKDIDSHIKNVDIVLNRLKEAGYKMSTTKCKFGMKKVKLLGHFVTEEGISVDEEKVACIKNLTPPKEVTDVRSIIGLCSYYRRFVPNFSKRAKPLTELMQNNNNPIKWEERHQIAFDDLKEALCSTPVLRHFDKDLPSVIFCDASSHGLGAVLSQIEDKKERVVAYASRQLNKTERNYSTLQREFLGLLFALEKFRCFIYGQEFKVICDNNPLLGLKYTTALTTSKLHRWCARLSEFSFTLEHRHGRLHSNADSLSRLWADKDIDPEEPKEANEFNINEPDCPLDFPVLTVQINEIKSLQLNDAYCYEKIKELEDQKEVKNFEIFEGKLYNTSLGTKRLVVPKILKEEILSELHNSVTAGHRGFESTYSKVSSYYHWQNMKKDIMDYVRRCAICQISKRPIRPPQGELGCIPIPLTPFYAVAIDTAGPLNTSVPLGNKFIFVSVCLLTKYVTLKAVPNQQAPEVAKFLLEEIFTKHGTPKKLISDRGSNYLSKTVLDLLENFGVQPCHTCAYNPQADGLAERCVATVKGILKMYVTSSTQDQWDRYLPYVAWIINTTVQNTTKKSPFELVFARKPLQPIDRLMDVYEIPSSIQQLKDAEQVRAKVIETIAKAQKRYKSRYDRGRVNVDYEELTYVLIKDPSNKKSVAPGFVRRWKGPYLITKRISSLNYEIQSGLNGPKRVVNIKRMKPYFSPYEVQDDEDSSVIQSTEEFLNTLHRFYEITEAHQEWDQILSSWKVQKEPSLFNPVTLILPTGSTYTLYYRPEEVLLKDQCELIRMIWENGTSIIVYPNSDNYDHSLGIGDCYKYDVPDQGTLNLEIYQRKSHLNNTTVKANITKSDNWIDNDDKNERWRREVWIVQSPTLTQEMLEEVTETQEASRIMTSTLQVVHESTRYEKNPILVHCGEIDEVSSIAVAWECIKALDSSMSSIPLLHTIKYLKSLDQQIFNNANHFKVMIMAILHYYDHDLNYNMYSFQPEYEVTPMIENLPGSTCESEESESGDDDTYNNSCEEDIDYNVLDPNRIKEGDTVELEKVESRIEQPQIIPTPFFESHLDEISDKSEEEEQEVEIQFDEFESICDDIRHPPTEQENSSSESEQTNPEVPYKTRAGREVKPPAYLDDYVQSADSSESLN